MKSEELRARQARVKELYRREPQQALVRLKAAARLVPAELACDVTTHAGPVHSALHPAAGGDPPSACSGDMLLESLVACAGVTLSVVATAMQLPLRGGEVRADADLDFRGTLGVDRRAPVGITNIRLTFELAVEASDEQIDKLIQLTERYCVILQSLRQPPQFHFAWSRK